MGRPIPYAQLFLVSAVFFFVIFAAILLIYWYRSRLRSGGRRQDLLSSVQDLEKKGGLTPEEMKRVRAVLAEKLKKSDPGDLL